MENKGIPVPYLHKTMNRDNERMVLVAGKRRKAKEWWRREKQRRTNRRKKMELKRYHVPLQCSSFEEHFFPSPQLRLKKSTLYPALTSVSCSFLSLKLFYAFAQGVPLIWGCSIFYNIATCLPLLASALNSVLFKILQMSLST